LASIFLALVLLLTPQLAKAQDTEELLCYHEGAAFFVKLPHPFIGLPERIYQRITPGGSGELLACQLRLYNEYPSYTSHNGFIIIAVHPPIDGYPGAPVFEREIATDNLGNAIFDWDIGFDYSFATGETFFLSMAYAPASPLDTIAIVTADIGTYTGHSFFFTGPNTTWWSDDLTHPLGDMHFCALVNMNEPEAFVHFPYSNLDLGRVEFGQSLHFNFPILNQGNAPLIFEPLVQPGSNWTVHFAGPDSLMPPDSLLLELTWEAPLEPDSTSVLLTLECNAPNEPHIELRLSAANSPADLLVNDWDETDLASIQYADTSSATGNWRFFTGLNRPGYFVGHTAPLGTTVAEDLLVIHDVPMSLGDWIEVRWSQSFANIDSTSFLAFVWRNPADGRWHVLDTPDIMSPPYFTGLEAWHSVPWANWGPCEEAGFQDFGFLYSGTQCQTDWFMDDLEFQLHSPLEAPVISLRRWRNGMRIEWDAVLNADSYLVEVNTTSDFESADYRPLAITQDTCWSDPYFGLGLFFGYFRVTAMSDEAVMPRALISQLNNGSLIAHPLPRACKQVGEQPKAARPLFKPTSNFIPACQGEIL
jgi:hypothetical protein